MTKQEHLDAWLADNPGKTDRDWLIEERCPDGDQRKQFQGFLAFCDENAIELIIPSRTEWIDRMPVQYDFAIRDFGSVYDLDAPDELYTGKNGYNEGGWMPFLNWKSQQVACEQGKAPNTTEMEHKHYGQFATTYCHKWNHPEVLTTLKEFFSKRK